MERLKHESASDSQSITIHISKRSLKNVVAAAAIIVLCALFSSPLDEAMRPSNQASLLPSEPETELRQEVTPPVTGQLATEQNTATATIASEEEAAPAETEAIAAEPATTDALKATAEPAPVAAPAPAVVAPEDKPAGNYCIVLASNVSKKNANNYVDILKGRGITNARVYNNGKMNRVIIDGFSNEEEAVEMNTELHHTNREYASTWVMAL